MIFERYFFGSGIKEKLRSSPSYLKVRLMLLSSVHYISEKYTWKKGDEFELRFVKSQASFQSI